MLEVKMSWIGFHQGHRLKAGHFNKFPKKGDGSPQPTHTT